VQVAPDVSRETPAPIDGWSAVGWLQSESDQFEGEVDQVSKRDMFQVEHIMSLSHT
jgi:hypothetical protein